MATRSKETAVIPGGADLPTDLEEVDEDSPFDRLISAFSGLGAGDKPPRIGLYSEVQVDHSQPYHVQQQQQSNLGKFQFLRNYTPEELDGNDLDMIRSQFGPGKYELRLYGYKPGSTRYTVIAKPQVLIGALPGAAPIQPVTVAQSAPQSDVTAVLSMIAKGQEQLLAALTQRPNQMDSMKDMLSMLVMMREAMGTNNQPQQQKSSITETLEAIKELRAMSDLINPKEPDESPEEKMMKMAQPLIGLATAAFQKPAHTVAPISPPLSFQEQPVIEQSQPTAAPIENDDAKIKEKLEADLKKLLEMAANNAPVEEGAEFLYENLPDEFVELLNMQMWWEGLSTHIPAVKPHEAWCRKVRDRLLEIFTEEAANAEEAHVTASKAATK